MAKKREKKKPIKQIDLPEKVDETKPLETPNKNWRLRRIQKGQ